MPRRRIKAVARACGARAADGTGRIERRGGRVGAFVLGAQVVAEEGVPMGAFSPQEKQVREMPAHPGDAARRSRDAVSSSESLTFARPHRAVPSTSL